MFKRIQRTAVSFFAVLAAFWAYRLAAVPFIDPPQQQRRIAKTSPDGPAPLVEQNRLGPYLRYFPEGSWERDNPIVLESNTMKAIVKKYEIGDGKALSRKCIRFSPCTLIFLPEGEVDNPDGRDRVVIMRTKDDQSAVLEFENDVDLTRPQLGKLVGGKISGDVIIYSAATKPEGGDDLEVHARDLEMIGNEITSKYPVQFRFGPSYGSGNDMHITLLPAPSSGGAFAPGIGGIQDFKLNREVQMHLQPGEAGFLPGDQQATQDDPNRRPIDIRCSGPFSFDLVANIAEFHDDVVMLRPNPGGRDDRLTARLASIFFAERELTPQEKAAAKAKAKNAQTAADAKPAGQQMPRLTPQKFEAHGDPVVVDAPSNGVYAVGKHMVYDSSTGRISLETAPGAPPVHLNVIDAKEGTARALEAKAQTLHFQAAPKGFTIGKLHSQGPGWLRATPRKDSTHQIYATWDKKLELRPDKGEHLLWIVGNAHVDFTDTGLIDADDICLWMSELPEQPAPANNNRAGSDQLLARIQPLRLLATGGPNKRVHIESRQLDGDTDNLQTWFRAIAANPNAPARANRPPRDPNRRRAPGDPKQRHVERDPDHYQVSCRQIETGILITGTRPGIEWAKLIDNVAFDQTPEKMGDEAPLSIRGDWLSLTDAETPREHVTVAGKPASILAQGLTMRGASVQLNRGSRRLWIEGPGDMHLPERPEPAGKVQAVSATNQPRDPLAMASGGPIDIQWQQGMDFDGRTVSFRKGVVAKQTTPDGEQTIRNELIRVTLRGVVDFSNTRQRQQQPEVELLEAPGRALLENRSFDKSQPLAYDRMELTDLRVNQITGETSSVGPGLAKSWRYGPKPELSEGGGLPFSNPRAPSDPRGPNPTAKPPEFQITYSQIEFENGISGNVLPDRQQLVFNDRVRGIFGPVPDWQTELVDESSQPGKMILHCDQLIASQPPRIAGNQPSMNVVTVGNTHVEGTSEQGQLFSADGHSLKYDQAKDQIILAGDGRTPAHASRQERIGEQRTEIAGQQLTGSLKNGRFDKFQGRLQHLDGSMLTPSRQPQGAAPQQRPR
jgi:hypothetical protein